MDGLLRRVISDLGRGRGGEGRTGRYVRVGTEFIQIGQLNPRKGLRPLTKVEAGKTRSFQVTIGAV